VPDGRRPDFETMFFLLRATLIIGLIFWFSPVRRESGSMPSPDTVAGWSRATPGAALDPVEQVGHLQSLWETLPDGVKRAAVGGLFASAPVRPPGPQNESSDTLLPEDLKPVWRAAIESRQR
jgi:hypothetical protein